MRGGSPADSLRQRNAEVSVSGYTDATRGGYDTNETLLPKLRPTVRC